MATIEIDLWQVRGVPVDQDGARSCPSPRRYDMGSFRCLNISTPTLRKVREGWGTHGAGCASKIKN